MEQGHRTGAQQLLTTMGCSCRMPAALQFLHMSKSLQTVQRSPVPGSISTWQKLQVDEKAGASGLCRWYSTIMLLCLARRRESNCRHSSHAGSSQARVRF